MIHETHARSLVKAISWRIIIFVSDFTIAYLLTGKFEFATSFAIIKFFIGFVLYFLHERGWNRVHWGRSSIIETKQKIFPEGGE